MRLLPLDELIARDGDIKCLGHALGMILNQLHSQSRRKQVYVSNLIDFVREHINPFPSELVPEIPFPYARFNAVRSIRVLSLEP